LRPYLKSDMGEWDRQPDAVLIIDDYGAHWTKRVRKRAAEMGVELIAVPPGYTATAQPLDVSVMGPFKKLRSVEWVKRRGGNADSVDDIRSSVLAALEAWDNVPLEACVAGWGSIGVVESSV